MIEILLVDDHQILREALHALLNAQSDLHVVAEANSGEEALLLAHKHHPQVVVVDMMMPGISGTQVSRDLRRTLPDVKVIVLSMFDTEGYVVEALRAGVVGYVLKQNSAQDLVLAIRQAMAGNIYLSPTINARALNAYAERAEYLGMPNADDPLSDLTDREREILPLAAQGMSNPQIANALTLSARTVEMHRSNLMRKLGLHTQTDLVRFALSHGIIS